MTDAITSAAVLLVLTMLGMATQVVRAMGSAYVARSRKEEAGFRAATMQRDAALVDDSVGVVVRMIEQTLAADLRRAAEDGRLTPDEKEDLRGKALAAAFECYGEPFWDGFFGNLGIVGVHSREAWLSARVEAWVSRLKADPKAPAEPSNP